MNSDAEPLAPLWLIDLAGPFVHNEISKCLSQAYFELDDPPEPDDEPPLEVPPVAVPPDPLTDPVLSVFPEVPPLVVPLLPILPVEPLLPAAASLPDSHWGVPRN